MVPRHAGLGKGSAGPNTEAVGEVYAWGVRGGQPPGRKKLAFWSPKMLIFRYIFYLQLPINQSAACPDFSLIACTRQSWLHF